MCRIILDGLMCIGVALNWDYNIAFRGVQYCNREVSLAFGYSFQYRGYTFAFGSYKDGPCMLVYVYMHMKHVWVYVCGWMCVCLCVHACVTYV